MHQLGRLSLGVALALSLGSLLLASGCESVAPVRGEAAVGTLDVDAETLLGSVAVLGAAVSDGFGLDGSAEGSARGGDGPANLAWALRRAIRVEGARVDQRASHLFLMDPLDDGPHQIEQGGAELWVALDYLFWFAYGPKTETERFESFEAGLELLGRIQEPLLIGDLPLVAEGRLEAEWIPSPANLEALNQRLDRWSAERPERLVVPVAAWMEAIARPDAELQLRDLSWSADAKTRLLQTDGLHPSREGLQVLALLSLDRLSTALADPAGLDAEVNWTVDTP